MTQLEFATRILHLTVVMYRIVHQLQVMNPVKGKYQSVL